MFYKPFGAEENHAILFTIFNKILHQKKVYFRMRSISSAIGSLKPVQLKKNPRYQ